MTGGRHRVVVGLANVDRHQPGRIVAEADRLVLRQHDLGRGRMRDLIGRQRRRKQPGVVGVAEGVVGQRRDRHRVGRDAVVGQREMVHHIGAALGDGRRAALHDLDCRRRITKSNRCIIRVANCCVFIVHCRNSSDVSVRRTGILKRYCPRGGISPGFANFEKVVCGPHLFCLLLLHTAQHRFEPDKSHRQCYLVCRYHPLKY